MKLLILRTDIKTKERVQSITPLFNSPYIDNWSIDIEDVDNVLRIEAKDELNEQDFIHVIKSCGYFCEALPD